MVKDGRPPERWTSTATDGASSAVRRPTIKSREGHVDSSLSWFPDPWDEELLRIGATL